VESYVNAVKAVDLAPTIISLRTHWESIRQQELAKSRSRLGTLTEDQRAAVESLTQNLLNKLLHGPISELKTQSQNPDGQAHIETIKRLLGLKDH
jgi:glutamyl-tRNA reductase